MDASQASEDRLPCLPRIVVELFAVEPASRDIAIRQLAALGCPVVPQLGALILRPLGFVMTHWPEWQQMLPTRAIMARCRFARQAALRVLVAIGSPAVGELSRLLQSHDADLRHLTAEALAAIGDADAVAVLKTWLEDELAQERGRRLRWLMDTKIGGSALFLVVGMLCWYAYPQALAGICLLVVSGLACWLLVGFPDHGKSVRLLAVQALGKAGDPALVDTLAACLSDPDRRVRQAASCALTQTLPGLRAQAGEQIAPETMTILLRALDGDDPALAVAILTAMQQIGDTRALHRVAYLIDSPLHFDAVRSAAEACLPHVKRRIKEAHQAQALLRPATVQAVVSSDLLLRPLQTEEAGLKTGREQLLRPR